MPRTSGLARAARVNVQWGLDPIPRGGPPLDLGDVGRGRGVRVPGADHGEVGGGHRRRFYQAWLVPQCGQPTEVDTAAVNA